MICQWFNAIYLMICPEAIKIISSWLKDLCTHAKWRDGLYHLILFMKFWRYLSFLSVGFLMVKSQMNHKNGKQFLWCYLCLLYWNVLLYILSDNFSFLLNSMHIFTYYNMTLFLIIIIKEEKEEADWWYIYTMQNRNFARE